MYRELRNLLPATNSRIVDWKALLDLLPALAPLADTPQDPL